MFERLERLFLDGLINEKGLAFWLKKGAITKEQYDKIISEKINDKEEK